ncbi:hypothetical protein EJD97_003131 [Solanum chilense]|uniref:Pectinesterase inhibitor domain-containing protein n=1 Tax=Solanum chilense TaxID=4083 RepID=A0A6N2C1R4_SOLCI|nr:hypothetical protein EJD97_003131 [Solanum chilense]
MALHNQVLLVISLSFLIFQFNIASPIPISYISLSPYGSPSPSQSPSSSLNYEMPDGNVRLGDKDSVNKYVDSLMLTSLAKTQQFLVNVVEKRLSNPSTDAFAKDCLLVCKEVYENAVDSMKKTIVDIKNVAYYSANVDLSALSTDLETCQDCVKEIFGNDKEFTTFYDWERKVTVDAMEKIAAFSS